MCAASVRNLFMSVLLGMMSIYLFNLQGFELAMRHGRKTLYVLLTVRDGFSAYCEFLRQIVSGSHNCFGV